MTTTEVLVAGSLLIGSYGTLAVVAGRRLWLLQRNNFKFHRLGVTPLTSHEHEMPKARVRRPFTIQEVIHFMVSLACTARCIYGALGAWEVWDGVEGRVMEPPGSFRVIIFRCSDGCATLLEFSILVQLAAFWAELHLTANGLRNVCRRWSTHILLSINISAYIGLCIVEWQSIKYGSTFSISTPYAWLISMSYAVAGGWILFFAYHAMKDLQRVPIDLGLRKWRVKNVVKVSGICVTCVLLRACLIIILANQNIQLNTLPQLCWVVAYFWLLELLPFSVVLSNHSRIITPEGISTTIHETAEKGGNFLVYNKPGMGVLEPLICRAASGVTLAEPPIDAVRRASAASKPPNNVLS